MLQRHQVCEDSESMDVNNLCSVQNPPSKAKGVLILNHSPLCLISAALTTKQNSIPISAMKTWPSLPSQWHQMLPEGCHCSVNLNSCSIPLFWLFFFFLKQICKTFLAQETFPCSCWNFLVSHILSMFLTSCMNSCTGCWQLHPVNQFTETGYFLNNKLIVLSTISGLASWASVLAKIQTAFLPSA